MRISEPGIYTNIHATDYHNDPCPAPALSASLAKLMLERSPAHCWHQSERLNPAYEPETSRKMAFGSAAHMLLIGNGRKLVEIDAEDYRTKDAKAARDKATAEGKTPILSAELHIAQEMAEAAREQIPLFEGCEQAFQDGGAGEAVLLWQDEAGCWGRAMTDWLSADRLTIYDYKTSTDSAHPSTVSRRLIGSGAHLQAAWYERGLLTLRPDLAGRVKVRFVVQETLPPYPVSVAELNEGAMMIGRKMASAAAQLWTRCLKDGVWPGYPTHVVSVEMPAYVEASWLNRETADEMLRGMGIDPFLVRAQWQPERPERELVGPF